MYRSNVPDRAILHHYIDDIDTPHVEIFHLGDQDVPLVLRNTYF